MLYLIPEGRTTQALLNYLGNIFLRLALDLEAISHILEDRLGKRIGTLKHHPDALTQQYYIGTLVIDINTIEYGFSLDTRTRNNIAHTIERTQEGRFATARRA